MAKSDVEAKVRLVVDSKTYNAALRQANKEAKEFRKQQQDSFKGVGDGISKAFGGAVSAIGKLAPALGLSASALAVARKAMQENQSITDEWGRITESARTTWEGFVNSLVSANFGSFLSNMDDIVSKARDAYDAMDALGTAKIFNSREMAKFSMDQERYLSILRNKNLSEAERGEAAKGLQGLFKQEDSWTKQMSDYHFEAFAKEFARIMTSRGTKVDWQSIIHRNGLGDYELTDNSVYSTYFRTLADYNAATARRNVEQKLRSTVVGSSYTPYGSVPIYGKGNMSDEEFRELNNAIEMSDEKMQSLYNLLIGAYQGRAQYYRNVGRANRYLNGLSGAGGGGSTSKVGEVFAEGSIGWVEQEVAKANKEWKSAVTEGERQAAQARLKVLQEELEVLKSGKVLTDKISLLGVNTPTDLFNPTDITAPTWRAEQVEIKEKGFGKVVNNTMQYVSGLTDVIGQLGITSMFSTGEVDKTAQIIGRMLSVFGSAVGGPFGSIVGGIGSLFAGGFATGGIVGGTSYKGDQLTAQVSSGEMILNKAQQRNLLALAGGGGAPSVTAIEVRGDKMLLLINNTLRSQGKSTIG